MAVTTASREQDFRGLRPLDPSRDLRQVAALISDTFGANLDAEGRAALREIQQMARLGPLVGFLLSADPQLRRMLNGYVWLEDGRVVGNLTLHNSLRFGSRWYIYNVAVAPEYRGKGIGQALLQAALDEVRQEGGGWATLQVEEDNEPARRLYEAAGFESLSALAHLQLSAPPPDTTAPAVIPGLRTWQPEDWYEEFELAKAAMPASLQWWQPLRTSDFRVFPEQRLGEWIDRLIGRRRLHRWVVESSTSTGGLSASLSVRVARWAGEHQLRLIVRPQARGDLEEPLLQRAVTSLPGGSRNPATTRHPAEHRAAIAAFQAHGFEIRRTLVVMRKRVR